jgi:hypothetical protein
MGPLFEGPCLVTPDFPAPTFTAPAFERPALELGPGLKPTNCLPLKALRIRFRSTDLFISSSPKFKI